VAPELIESLDPERVRANLDAVRTRITGAAERAGRDPSGVEICVAGKYVGVEAMGALAQAGVTLVGENRAQDLAAKAARWGDAFTWDFIGHLQSRKVRDVLPHTRLLHAVSSDSVLEQLARHATPEREVLVEVNVAGEASKAGVAPADLGAFIARCPVRVVGLMTMPPLTDDPQDSRPWFAALRDLAAEHGLPRLSMGTTQDFEVAVEEGATIVRIGTIVVA
jgi:pyridoxal phosphate enzyme (YggS family)